MIGGEREEHEALLCRSCKVAVDVGVDADGLEEWAGFAERWRGVGFGAAPDMFGRELLPISREDPCDGCGDTAAGERYVHYLFTFVLPEGMDDPRFENRDTLEP